MTSETKSSKPLTNLPLKINPLYKFILEKWQKTKKKSVSEDPFFILNDRITELDLNLDMLKLSVESRKTEVLKLAHFILNNFGEIHFLCVFTREWLQSCKKLSKIYPHISLTSKSYDNWGSDVKVAMEKYTSLKSRKNDKKEREEVKVREEKVREIREVKVPEEKVREEKVPEEKVREVKVREEKVREESDNEAEENCIDLYNWGSLDNYSRYQFSRDGEVKNINTGKIIEGTVYDGYKKCTLYGDDDSKVQMPFHKIIALTFIPNPNNYPVINHKDGNKLNNRVSNLEWASVKRNTQHACDIGLNKVTNRKPVRRTCPNTGETKEYPSITEAFEDNKEKIKYPSYITNVISGKMKRTGGYYWECTESKEENEDEKQVENDIEDEYKVIKGFPNYLIYSDGRVYSRVTKKFLKPSLKQGYLIVDLYGATERRTNTDSERSRNNYRSKHRVHRLVAEHFIKNSDPELLTDVNHKNKIRTDNRVENLHWVSSAENQQHAHNTPVIQLDSEYNIIGRYRSLVEAGQQTGVSSKNISQALKSGQRAGGFFWKRAE